MTESMLTRNAFDASRVFIEASARPLEVARFHHAFDGASITPVLVALKTYQNPDGGFGHALEPDFRAAESSALCTSHAFQIFRSINANSDDSIVSSAIDYILNTLDRTEDHWRIIPRMVQECPHAPWWDQAGRESDFDFFSLNPTAEILGYLYDYLGEQQSAVLSKVSQRVINQLSGVQQLEMHELLCCLRLLQTKRLLEEIERPVLQKLIQLVDGTISTDPKQWKGYGLRPLQVVDHPESPFLAGLEASVAANLDYEIATQNPDGSWSPTWTWGGVYPADWIIASRQWSGVLTLEKLLLLKRFHRIEGLG